MIRRQHFLKAICFITVSIFSSTPIIASGKKDTTSVPTIASETVDDTAASTSAVAESDSSETNSTPSATDNVGAAEDSDSSSITTETVTLKRIDQLIKQTKYSEALTLLAEYIKLYPDNFDAAKTRIDRIMTKRHDYNSVEDNLIDLAANSPTEADKNYQMVLQLEKMEQQPSVIHETIRTEVKNLTQFKACQQRFNEILTAAVTDVKNKKYAEAAEEFRRQESGKQSAFEVYQEDFIAQNNPRTITQSVDKSLAAIDSAITDFGTVQNELQSAYNQYMSAVKNHRYTEAQTALAQVQTSFTKLAKIRNSVADAGWQLEAIFADMKKQKPDLTDASYLPFASRFVLGIEKDHTSGILGAMDAEWNNLVSDMKEISYQTALSDSEQFATSLAVNSLFTYPAVHQDGRTAITSAKQFAALGNSVNSMYDLIKKKNGSTALADYAVYSSSMDYISRFSTVALNLFDQVRNYANESQKVGAYKESTDLASAIRSQNDVYTTALIESASTFVSFNRDALSERDAPWLKKYAGNTEPSTPLASATDAAVTATDKNTTPDSQKYVWNKAYTAYVAACDALSIQSRNSAESAWSKTAASFASAGTLIVAEYESRSKNAHALMPEENNAQDTQALPYPKECIVEVEKIQKDILVDTTVLTSCRTKLDGGRAFQTAFASQRTQLDEAINKLASYLQDCTTLAQRARIQSKNANLAKSEADLRYQQSKNALSRNDFDSARDYLQQARDKYNESLGLQEDADLRKSSDTNLVALGADIARQENEIVVRDVRKLKTEAKDAYYAGNFDQAETLLTRAEARWQVTNVDNKDDELENLKALVNTALSMKTGRVIPPTAALYPEMSQILSIANQYYTQGQKLMQQNKKAEATDILNQAKKKLNELKLVYPLNQEASLLTLRIDQLLDRQAFNTMFAQKVANAKINYKSSDANTKQQAYSDLVDLYEINPDYPGLSDLIYQVQIELGLRKKPVDNSSLKKAQTLANQAKALLASAGRDPAKLEQAKQRALQAIALDQGNDLAMTVLDEVALKAGGQAVVVLSATDEVLYQKAVQELQKNNIIAANTIVQQLLNKPSNRRSAKILELQKKVQALL